MKIPINPKQWQQTVFHGKNGPNLPDFEKKEKRKKRVSKSPNFYDKFQ
jgi:hypothetical protein